MRSPSTSSAYHLAVQVIHSTSLTAMRSPSTSSAYHLAVQVIQSASLTAIQIPKNDDNAQIPTT